MRRIPQHRQSQLEWVAGISFYETDLGSSEVREPCGASVISARAPPLVSVAALEALV
jgi:hypothetical protein